MGHDREPETRKLRDLRKGDIIRTRIPFEENTTDYYNGYQPKEIRGESFKDRFGQTSKPRFVVVVGREDNNIIYLPLTSRHSGCDTKHQYMLQDNSMTWKRSEDMKSYVECDSLRSVHASPNWDIQYFGRIEENDMANIMSKAGKRKIDFESKRDQRSYVSRSKDERFEAILEENGFKDIHAQDTMGKVFMHDDGRTVEKQRWGLVRYHVPLSKEEVTEMVAAREGKPVDDFTKAIADITEKSQKKESEVSL